MLRDELFHHLSSKHRVISERSPVSRTSNALNSRTATLRQSWNLTASTYDKAIQCDPDIAPQYYGKLRETLKNRLQNRGEDRPTTAYMVSARPNSIAAASKDSLRSSTSSRYIGHLQRLLTMERKVTTSQKRVYVEEKLHSHRRLLSQ